MSDFLKGILRPAPHRHHRRSTPWIMGQVLLALTPVVGLSLYKYGFAALAMVLVCSAFALLAERLVHKEGPWHGDGSALITGVLLALTLPPAFPLWMAAVGSLVAIWVGKFAFGGLGQNPFNPAIMARIFLQATFPQAMTQWSTPFGPERFWQLYPSNLTWPFLKPLENDAVTAATPLGALKFDQVLTDLGRITSDQVAGCLGEVNPWVILICGLYLILKGAMEWRIPLGILASVALLGGFFGLLDPALPGPLWMLASGGLMLGAMFMATDMATSPITPKGIWIYAVLIGVLILVIRLFGGLPEGVAFAILLGNALVPLIHRFTQPRVYGHGLPAKTEPGPAPTPEPMPKPEEAKP